MEGLPEQDARALNNTFVGYNGLINDFKQAGIRARAWPATASPPPIPGLRRRHQSEQTAGGFLGASGFLVLGAPLVAVAVGAAAIVDVLRMLLSNPAVWEKTALIVIYDENGGFFDHVIPPTPPPGTPGEFVTAPDIDLVPGSGGIRGPIGLGFRVPCFVVSPFSRGALNCQ